MGRLAGQLVCESCITVYVWVSILKKKKTHATLLALAVRFAALTMMQSSTSIVCWITVYKNVPS